MGRLAQITRGPESPVVPEVLLGVFQHGVGDRSVAQRRDLPASRFLAASVIGRHDESSKCEFMTASVDAVPGHREQRQVLTGHQRGG